MVQLPFPMQAQSLTAYVDDKNSGRPIVVAKVNDAYVLSAKRFDPNTGVEIDPVVQTLDKKQIEATVAALQAQIDSLQALLADMAALDPDPVLKPPVLEKP